MSEGLRFEKRPASACPVIFNFVKTWAWDLLSDEERTRLLEPFVTLMLNTDELRDVSDERAWMAVDWLVRTFCPEWLSLGGFSERAETLRALPYIGDTETASRALEVINAADAEVEDEPDVSARLDELFLKEEPRFEGESGGSAAYSAAAYAPRTGMAAGGLAYRTGARASRHAFQLCEPTAVEATTKSLKDSASKLILRMCREGDAERRAKRAWSDWDETELEREMQPWDADEEERS